MSSSEYQKDLSRDSAKNDYNRDSSSSKDFIIGAVVGGIVGAAAALFLAPKSGKEFRGDLNDGAKLLSDKTEKIRKTAIEKGAELTEVAKAKTSSLSETVSKQTSALKENVKKLQRHDQAETVKENEPVEEAAASAQLNAEDVQRKLDEAEKALEETEKKLNQ